MTKENVANVDSPSEATPEGRVEEPQATVADVSDLIVPASPATAETTVQQTADNLLSQRRELDATLWAPEVAAQRHEQPFIRLWDELRERADKFSVAKAFPFETMHLATFGAAEEIGLGIHQATLSNNKISLDQQGWQSLLDKIAATGYQIVQTEWHHASFDPNDPVGPRSVVTFVIDLARDQPARLVSVRGKLDVVWARGSDDRSSPVPRTITLSDAVMLSRDREPAFREILTAETDSLHPRLMPLMLYDLNGDGLSEIILGGLNRIYWNEGKGSFRSAPIVAAGLDIFDAAVLGDFDGDGKVDLVCVGRERYPLILKGSAGGRFSQTATRCADVTFELPKSFTAGDMDGDGDLDLWIGQYKFPYLGGAMPTPFYDANDGFPAVLLQNDGKGQFTDVTEQAGLGAKRNRRTYSSSFIDLDGDRDLDLITVNDFCGADIYENDGRGSFTDVSPDWLSDRHLFGMGHTFADFNLDGRLDMYLIGMSSTTARRLDSLRLGRDEHPDINRMRAAMGYGNRMMLRQPGSDLPRYVQAPYNDQVARTGWSWGTSSFDLENDGDPDVYVANGHNSGKSARDYCTRYWCHDVYTGTSAANQEVFKLFGESLRDLHQGEISWNGFEHNVLWLNQEGRNFTNVAFLLGVGFEFDSRGVATDDLDGDGRTDLLVVQYRSERIGHAEYTLHVLRNDVSPGGNWIGVRLDESALGRSPIGANVLVTTANGTYRQTIVNGDSFSSQHAPVVHFGLGAADQVQRLVVEWPDGTRVTKSSPSVNCYVEINAQDVVPTQ